MDNTAHSISGSLRVGPFAEERSDADAEPAINFLDVLCQSLRDDAPLAAGAKREQRTYGDEDTPFVFIEDAIRTEPPPSQEEAPSETAPDKNALAQPREEAPTKLDALDEADQASESQRASDAASRSSSASRGESPSRPEREGSRSEESLDETKPPADDGGGKGGPADAREPGPHAVNNVEPETQEGGARIVPLATARADDTVLHAGSHAQVAGKSLSGPGDIVSAVESASAADGAGGNAARAAGSGLGVPGGGASTDAGAVEQLDGAFKQVLSKAALPHDLLERIELARAVGRQVIRHAVVSVKNGQTHVMLQLRPPTLGTVRMHLTTEGNTISAKLSVENAPVREVIEQHLAQLRSVLRDEGFTLARFEVAVHSETGAEPWPSDHAETDAQNRGHADAGQQDESPEHVSDEAVSGVEPRWASAHDGTVDYLA